jgi:excinuclease ABC subunit C
MTGPEATGVYVMKDRDGKVLYVGKALNLKSRTNQYFRLQDSRAMVPRLLSELDSIEYILTTNEKEALLLERQLVRKLKPGYNILLRDDKNFLLVRVDFAVDFPRFEFVRRRKRDGASYFGPYPSAAVLREYVRLVSRAFTLRTCNDRKLHQRVRPCVMHQMGWCTAPCVYPEKNGDYKDRLRRALELLTNRRTAAARLVERFMYQASEDLRFEDAARYRDLLEQLQSIWAKQTVAISSALDADVFAIHHGPLGGAVFVLHVRDSAVVGTNSFFNEGFFTPETFDLESFVYQFYEDRVTPPVVLGDFAPGAGKVVEELLGEECGRKVKLIHPRRGQKRSLVGIALTNAAQVYDERSRVADGRRELLEELADLLGLDQPPLVVECVDISSFQGSDAVGSISVARNAVLAKSEYRSFHIRGPATNDFEMIREVVQRRLKMVRDVREPRLILVDGGRAHLAAAVALLPDGAGHIHMAAIAKARPEQGLPEERVFAPGSREPLALTPDSRILLFIASLRDEAHRFGVAFHRKKRSRRVISSPLLDVPGIGRKRRMVLIRHFGSLKGISSATVSELGRAKGISRQMAQRIFDHLQETS